VLRAQGHEDDSKKILIGMADDRRKWGGLGRPSRAWEWILGATIGYGYTPLRASVWLAALWLIGSLLFWAGYRERVMLPSNKDAFAKFVTTGDAPGWYEPFSPIIYTADTLLPVISFGQRDRWFPDGRLCKPVDTASPADEITCPALAATLSIYRWVHLALGWVLALLFVAGITGFVKRE
jgi:hypothetical protein